METNIFLLSWLLLGTNVAAVTTPISSTEKEFLVLTIEYRTNVQITVSSNVIAVERSVLKFNGTNWVPAPSVPEPVVSPPLPPGLQSAVPKPPLPRFSIPTMPPPLPDAAMLEKERLEREKVANDKRDPKRRS